MDILPQLVANSVIAGAIYALLALGFNLIYGTVKFFDLGYGALTAVGGYAVFLFYKKLDWPLALSVILGVLIAGAIGWLANELVYKKLRARRASNMVLLVASLGIFTLLQALIAIFFTSQFQTLANSAAAGRVLEVGSAVITPVQLIILASGLAIMGLLALGFKKTFFGKAIKAVADDEEVARVVGLNTARIIGGVFFIGSALAGLAGILVGFDTGIEPTMGLSLLLKGVIASIVGGIGNVYGGVLGAFLLGFVENFGIWKISGEWKDAIAFGLLIIFLLFRPRGLIRQ
ncbi:MAG: branched-chain amino acid ABC transporter permease [Patescibacteria group bacterium]